jgi:DNA-binding PadR family transcriptional regulator
MNTSAGVHGAIIALLADGKKRTGMQIARELHESGSKYTTGTIMCALSSTVRDDQRISRTREGGKNYEYRRKDADAPAEIVS